MSEMVEHPNEQRLDALVDGELAPAEASEVQQHLESCAPCALHVLSTTQLKAATARAGHSHTPPPDALARLTTALRKEMQPDAAVQNWHQSPSPRAGFTRVAWGLLAAGMVMAVSLLGWNTLHNTRDLSTELLDQHLAALTSGATPQVISTDRHTVKPWFQGRLPFSFNLPESLPPGAVLKGADFTYLGGKPAALLLFTMRQHQISMFLTQRSAGPHVNTLPVSRAGFSISEASTPNLAIVALSDVNPHELAALVAAVVSVQ